MRHRLVWLFLCRRRIGDRRVDVRSFRSDSAPDSPLLSRGNDSGIPPKFAALDLGLLLALGGCLLAIGATALVLVHGPIRRGERWARLALLLLVGVSEGINSYQMSRFGAPFYAPLAFVAIMLTGIGLIWPSTRSPGHVESHAEGH